MNRRDFLKLGGAAGLGAMIPSNLLVQQGKSDGSAKQHDLLSAWNGPWPKKMRRLTDQRIRWREILTKLDCTNSKVFFGRMPYTLLCDQWSFERKDLDSCIRVRARSETCLAYDPDTGGRLLAPADWFPQDQEWSLTIPSGYYKITVAFRQLTPRTFRGEYLAKRIYHALDFNEAFRDFEPVWEEVLCPPA